MPDLDYLSLASAMHRLTEPAVRSAISALPVVPGSWGLDLACGNGDHSIWLAQSLSSTGKVVGFDISAGCLHQAMQSSAKEGLNERLAFILGDLNHLPFPDHIFDWIWCADCLWPGPKSLGFLGMDLLPSLQELMRVTRPGGNSRRPLLVISKAPSWPSPS